MAIYVSSPSAEKKIQDYNLIKIKNVTDIGLMYILCRNLVPKSLGSILGI